MADTNSRWRLMRRVTILFRLLLAFSGVACNVPTEPTLDELVGIYTGRWRGNINGFEVVLDVRAEPGNAERWVPVGLHGTGTALNPATGEIHRLTAFGQTAGGNSTSLQLRTPDEFGPGGFVLGGNKHIASFDGYVSPDDRTWTVRWRPTDFTDGAPIFGQVTLPVRLIKD
jgi:hypothetical protein